MPPKVEIEIENLFKRMNIIAEINKLFMDVEGIKWIKESEYDL